MIFSGWEEIRWGYGWEVRDRLILKNGSAGNKTGTWDLWPRFEITARRHLIRSSQKTAVRPGLTQEA